MDYWALQQATVVPAYELMLNLDCICTIMRNIGIQKGLVKP